MRALLSAMLAGVFCACAGTTASTHPYQESLARLDAAVAGLPASDGKTAVVDALDRLDREIASDAAASRYDEAMARLEQLSELAAAMAPQKLELGFATAFKDWTGDGKDDGLEVYFTPRDKSGSAVKYPGTADVWLHSEGFLGRDKLLDQWNLAPGVLANLWNESLFPAYVLRLPWNAEAPEVDYAVVTVSFKPIAAESLTARVRITRTPSQ